LERFLIRAAGASSKVSRSSRAYCAPASWSRASASIRTLPASLDPFALLRISVASAVSAVRRSAPDAFSAAVSRLRVSVSR
jgi:hypothetical protein